MSKIFCETCVYYTVSGKCFSKPKDSWLKPKNIFADCAEKNKNNCT